LHLHLSSNTIDMKKTKKDAASFQQLDAVQMSKIGGGQWIEIKNPDGTTTTVEV